MGEKQEHGKEGKTVTILFYTIPGGYSPVPKKESGRQGRVCKKSQKPVHRAAEDKVRSCEGSKAGGLSQTGEKSLLLCL